MFDVPLPMRRAQRDPATAGDESPNEGTTTPPTTMAFSLMTKKGNRQQVRLDDAVNFRNVFTELRDRLDPSNCLPTPTLPLP